MCGIPDLAIAIHQDTACQWIFISICAWLCCVRFSVAAMMAMMIGDPCFNLRGLDQWIKWNGCTTFTLRAARAGGDQAGKTLSQVVMRSSGWPGAAIGPLRITHPLLLAEEARHWRWWGQLTRSWVTPLPLEWDNLSGDNTCSVVTAGVYHRLSSLLRIDVSAFERLLHSSSVSTYTLL